MTGELTRNIKLLLCPSCPAHKRCFIGPDPHNLGVFNYNNSVLFSHKLLDKYTSRYTTSETLFAVFMESMGRLYKGRGQSFVKEDLLRSVWFAYVNTQDLAYDMSCQKCGDEPNCLIWDGVTLGFGRKHVLDTLRPLTHVHAKATDRYRQYINKPQLIPDHKEAPIRRLLKKWISIKKRKPKPPLSDDKDIDKEPDHNDFNVLLSWLMMVSEAAAVLLQRTLRPNGDINGQLKRLYVRLFEQISAEESAVQMIMPRCLLRLKAFTENPRWEAASGLIEIPALYHVLEAEFKSSGGYPSDLMNVCWWLHSRASTVLEDLCRFAKDKPSMASLDIREMPFCDD
ncbi:hypothetical protein V5O48_005763 [Marasmius crinis-equi]|uniref:HMG domain-containing protein n=1 Tax=Marasmius crinis-equi TaxID=585013 RepID=A0ABR3FLD3_9AGAR